MDIFEQEYNWLSNYLPKALANSKKLDSLWENNADYIYQSILNKIMSFEQTKSFNNEFINAIETKNINLVVQDTFDKVFDQLFHYGNSNNSRISPDILLALVSDIGREAFGMYLSMHYYFKSKKNPWGIYLFADVILLWAEKLYNDKGKSLGLSIEEVQYAFTYAVFRHNLFHFQVERYSTEIEILTHKVNFRQYKKNVYWPTKHSEDWLEKILAEVTVLNTLEMLKKTDLISEEFRKLYEFDLKKMPSGYKHYHCNKYGGPRNAISIFASQIAQCKIDVIPAPPAQIFKFNFIEFATHWKQIPLYLVKFKNPCQI